MWVLTLAGRDRDGEPFGTFLLDSTVGGAGAYLDHDGLDASGEYPVPRPAVANVESNEAGGPYLYLYRRLLPDTGGPGRTRGGAASGLAVTPHDTDQLHAMLIGHGVEVPNSTGIFGGMEAGCNQAVVRSAEPDDELPLGQVTDRESILKLGGRVQVLGAKPGHFDLHAGDILAYGFQGGGGYGDPLERDPAQVLRDVVDGFVSLHSARQQYGVVILDGSVDLRATEHERARIRSMRLDGRQPTNRRRDPATGMIDIGGVMLVSASGALSCYCGQRLGAAHENFKDHVVTRVVDPSAHGTRIQLHDDLELREHICPGCGALLESEVALKGAASLHTIRLAESREDQAGSTPTARAGAASASQAHD
jgi:N-methylhydantoinase B